MSTSQYIIIFCDLVGSSEVATEVSPDDYAKYIQSFYFAGTAALKFAYEIGWKEERHSLLRETTGDELLIMKKIVDIDQDIFTALAFVYTFKLYWLMSAYTVKKILNHRPPREISFGLHVGDMARVGESEKWVSYDINIAKRVEGISREGVSSNVFVTKYIAEKYSQWRREHIFTNMNQLENIRVLSCTDFLTAEAKKLRGISGQVYVCEAIPKFNDPTAQAVFKAIKEGNQDYRSYLGMLSCIHILALNFKSNKWVDDKHPFIAEGNGLSMKCVKEFADNLVTLSLSSGNRWFNLDTFYIISTLHRFIETISGEPATKDMDFTKDREMIYSQLFID
ncbi:MAG TPA: hypothetical protein ENI73_00610 [Spirochaetes bacterium]|nr:hypothetical protein [Spirochaetota bacterium]